MSYRLLMSYEKLLKAAAGAKSLQHQDALHGLICDLAAALLAEVEAHAETRRSLTRAWGEDISAIRRELGLTEHELTHDAAIRMRADLEKARAELTEAQARIESLTGAFGWMLGCWSGSRLAEGRRR